MSDKRRTFRLTFAAATVLLAGIAALLVAVLGDLRGARLDLTEEKLFTLSPASREILQGLQVPVQIRLYISPEQNLPTAMRDLERNVTEQLLNYVEVSDGQIEFSVHNPEDDPDLQEELFGKRIEPFWVESIGRGEVQQKVVWAAMTIAYKDQPEEVIPRLMPGMLPNLETLVIGQIHALSRERDPVVALYAPRHQLSQQEMEMHLQMGRRPPEPQDRHRLVKQLLQQQDYVLRDIQLTEQSPIPDDADVLVVLGPRELAPRQAWEINRALSNGLPVLMAVQNREYAYQPDGRGGLTVVGQPIATGAEGLLSGLGVGVSDDHLLDANGVAVESQRLAMVDGRRVMVRGQIVLPMIMISPDQINEDAEVTNHVGGLFYVGGSAVQPDSTTLARHDLAAEVLVTSSERSWQLAFGTGRLTPDQLDPQNQTMTGPHPLAVLVTGTFPDAFADQAPPPWPDTPDTAASTAFAPLEPTPSTLLVTGSARMFEDENLQQQPVNAQFLLNGVDFLAGSKLLTIRSKQAAERTIASVPAGQKLMWQILVVGLMPAVFVVLGILRTAQRRRQAAQHSRRLESAA